MLFDEAIQIFAKVDGVATLWTFIATCLPLRNASGTAELITFHALFGVLNDLKAYKTTKVVIEGLHSIIGLQMLINIDEITL